MAAASPIILNSSSPVSYQASSITPPSTRNSKTVADSSSSPGLASPSTFLNKGPRLGLATGLKTGSRAQQAPDGAQIAFASAGSLWKVYESEEEKQRSKEAGRNQDVSKDKSKAGTGKLVRPKKAKKVLEDGEPSAKKQKLDEYAHLEADEPKPKKRKTKAAESKAGGSKAKEAHQSKTALAEYALDADTKPKSAADVDKIEKRKSNKTSKKAIRADAAAVEQSKEDAISKPEPAKAVKTPAIDLAEFALRDLADQRDASPSADPAIPKPRVQHSPISKIDGSANAKSQLIEAASNTSTKDGKFPVIALDKFAFYDQTRSMDRDDQASYRKSEEQSKTLAQALTAEHAVDKAPTPKANATLQLLAASGETRPLGFAKFALHLPTEPVIVPDLAVKEAPKPKKARKKAENLAEANDGAIGAPVKKPRKRKKKSESVILNSDEPELFNGPNTTSNYFGAAHCKADKPSNEVLPGDELLQEGELATTTRVLPALTDDHIARITHEKSDYFSGVEMSAEGSPKQIDNPVELTSNETNGHGMMLAPSKRRGWTPVKDSSHVNADHRPSTAHSAANESESSAGPKRQIADVLGSFGYVSDALGIQTSERAVTGEATTKRRRIELAPPVGIRSGAASPDKAAEPSPPKPERQKKARKKAQTITALATAAFQPPEEVKADDGAISNFFSPAKVNATNANENAAQPKAKIAKPRKPRKPKAKDDAGAANAKPKPASKSKKTKVKFNKADYRPKLYSPGRATAQLKGQDFLFGTSSQLAIDEPASFIRDVQVAIQQSELPTRTRLEDAPLSSQVPFSQVQRSPQGKSCMRVPTAPHGTCLSIEQARRELWCVSTRDEDGGVLKAEAGSGAQLLDPSEETTASSHLALPNDHVDSATEVNVEADEELQSRNQVLERPVESGTNEETTHEPEHVVVDLCDTSLAAAREDIDLDDPDARPDHDHGARPLSSQHYDNHSDDWMLIQSSSPLPENPLLGPARAGPVPHAPRNLSDAKLLSPRRFRPPLSPLNPNALMTTDIVFGKMITSGQMRPLSSSPAGQARKSRSKSPAKRGPGRPRKEISVPSSAQDPPKRRGRPPKAKALASEPSVLPKAMKQKTAKSASQPVEPTEFIDIDDIYDSDAPATPSPPRRRATSSPPAVQPLTLSPPIQTKAPAATTQAALKSKDSHWQDIRSDLFDRILAVIKFLPPSNDKTQPNWYEKILLYDPIVLEDLTVWLNEQGLRVEIKKVKAKAKKRGRKRKDAAADEGELEEEWEVQYEPLQAWMVQKFCEEKSICCLWKEGLRGGVRARY